jgi:Cys-rich repeat protein
MDGQCVSAGCTDDADCLVGQCCQNSVCEDMDCGNLECGLDPVCSMECGPCPAGETCVDGTCEAGAECLADSDCLVGEVCENGQCVEGCRTDRDCRQGLICDTSGGDPGVCVECIDDADCTLPGWICGADGFCHGECQNDRDCPGNQVCDRNLGYCVDCLDRLRTRRSLHRQRVRALLQRRRRLRAG